MSRFYDSEFERDMMISAGFELVAEKLRSAAEKTEMYLVEAEPEIHVFGTSCCTPHLEW